MIFGNFFAAENWVQNFFVVGLGSTLLYMLYSAVTTKWDDIPADQIYIANSKAIQRSVSFCF